jgi:hypothetical protein
MGLFFLIGLSAAIAKADKFNNHPSTTKSGNTVRRNHRTYHFAARATINVVGVSPVLEAIDAWATLGAMRPKPVCWSAQV